MVLLIDLWLIVLLIIAIAGPLVFISILHWRGIRRPASAPDTREGKRLSIIIPVHKSAAPLVQKLEAMALPGDWIHEVIVACDGPVEELDKLNPFSKHITILKMPRRGKNPTLNEAAKHATGEVILISDREAALTPTALAGAATSFSSESIGGICGMLELKNDNSMGQQSHWNVENRIKSLESETLGNLTAATGSAMAILKECWTPIPPGGTDDLFIALSTKNKGQQFLFQPLFLATTPPRSKNFFDTFKRQQRITVRSYTTLFHNRQLLKPSQGHFAIMLFLHKILRRQVPLLFLTLTVFATVTMHTTAIQSLLAFTCLSISIVCAGCVGATVSGLTSANIIAKVAWLSAVQLGILSGTFKFIINQRTDTW